MTGGECLMSNDECLKNDEARMTKWSALLVIGHPTLVIRH